MSNEMSYHVVQTLKEYLIETIEHKGNNEKESI
jgi:hypothetical protein